MKRDMDLVRQILLAAEANEHGLVGGNPDIDGYTDEQVAYHVYLMNEAGLVQAADTTSMGSDSPEAMLNHLTWSGHDFLDAAREPSRWQKAKEIIAKAGGATFQIWLAVLTDLVKKGVGL